MAKAKGSAAYIGQAAAEQIDAWKEQYNKVFAVKTEDEDGAMHIAYLRKPSRRHISAATVAGKNDPLKFNETLLRECWLGGSEQVRTDDDMFLSVGAVLVELVQTKEAELVKL